MVHHDAGDADHCTSFLSCDGVIVVSDRSVDIRPGRVSLRASLYGHFVWVGVFLAPVGSFIGVWLGGTFYDQFGSYTIVWWVGVATGVLSTVVHLPIKEAPRLTPAAVA